MTNEIKSRIEKISSGEVPEGYKKTTCGIIPNDWNICRLKNKFSRLKTKNTEGNTNVLTISAQYGLINQEEFFKKEIASEDKSNYFLLNKGDFAYNKSYSNGYPYGAIKPLTRYDKGIVSPLYICFSPTEDNLCTDYFTQYFEFGLMNKEIHAIAQEGARNHGLLNISMDDFFNTNIIIPPLPEQQKIAEILSTQDKVIALMERKTEELKKLKKAYLEKMFPKKGSCYPEIRFKGFTDAWEQRKFGEIAFRESQSQLSTEDMPCVEYEDVVANEGQLNKDISLKTVQKKGIVFDGTQVLYGKLRPYLHNWLNPDFKGVAVGDWWVLKPINTDKNFVYRLIQTQQFDDVANLSAGSKMPRADWNLVSETEFCIPVTIDEQSKIAEYFTDLDNLITLHQCELEQEKLKKKALMQMLLTGIVRVKT